MEMLLLLYRISYLFTIDLFTSLDFSLLFRESLGYKTIFFFSFVIDCFNFSRSSSHLLILSFKIAFYFSSSDSFSFILEFSRSSLIFSSSTQERLDKFFLDFLSSAYDLLELKEIVIGWAISTILRSVRWLAVE